VIHVSDVWRTLVSLCCLWKVDVPFIWILADKGNMLKGKKDVFHDDILISDIDANRLKKYFQENFVASSK